MKTFLVSFALSACCLTAFAQTYFEPFADATGSGGTAYANADNLAGEINAQANKWYPVGTSSTGASVIITNGSLNVTNTLPAGTGNSVLLVNQLGVGGRFNIGGHSTATNLTLFYSVFIQLNDITSLSTNANTVSNSGGVFNMGFNNTTGSDPGQGSQPSIIGATLYMGSTNGGYILGTGRNTGNLGNRFWETNTATPHQVGEVLFVVLEYEAVAGATNNDLARLWINPNPSTFGAATYPTPDVIVGDPSHMPASDADLSTINSFVLMNRNATQPNNMIVDELRIGTNWAQVTPSTNAVAVIPILNISTVDPNTVQLSWRADATGFTLQSVAQLLSSGTPWANVPGSPTPSDTNLIQTDAISGTKFYRLIK